MKTSPIPEIMKVFLKLGCLAFGGPVAHIAMMEDEVVAKRKWMSREHFLDLVGATNLIPGPNSTEMAIHCGFHRGGWPGLILAGVCFIFPAVLITGCFAHLYLRYGTLPEVQPFVYGIRPAVLAIIIGAIIKLGQKALKSSLLAAIGAAVMAASLLGVNEIIAILGGGVLGMVLLRFNERKGGAVSPVVIPFTGVFNTSTIPLLAAVSPFMVPGFSLPVLFWTFLKIGFVLFGSGYVLIAYLEGDFVNRLGWLTQQQLLDAVAIGQFTPGPVLSTATFIGYILEGFSGAVVATVAIFLPAFILVALLNPLIPKLRRSKRMASFLDAVNVSAIGIMAAVTVMLFRATAQDWKTALIALVSIALTLYFKRLSTLWIVLGGAFLGYALFFC